MKEFQPTPAIKVGGTIYKTVVSDVLNKRRQDNGNIIYQTDEILIDKDSPRARTTIHECVHALGYHTQLEDSKTSEGDVVCITHAVQMFMMDNPSLVTRLVCHMTDRSGDQAKKRELVDEMQQWLGSLPQMATPPSAKEVTP